ncbi:helix-turn-helix transcriptional regulator [Mesobacillus zeae]|uniref:XRE family transcriptional regulator n=1 Tax=Mesobacillus zeae TaxID=1917180 RepID=A0A398B5B9_9BACI|nr:helix-turn-helix transcriptional regulator [Mesobacillus zeae]RID85052.1 XRE family transcriptional regulator [Mesobacillus zeae]
MKPRTWLHEERAAAKRTQEEVAEAAGIKRPYYSQIESGVRRPSVDVAKKIAGYIGFDWVLFFENNCSDKRQKSNTA